VNQEEIVVVEKSNCYVEFGNILKQTKATNKL